MYYKRAKLRFQCTQCGACCVGGGDYFVYVSKVEAERIRIHLGINKPWFRRRYLRHQDDEWVLAEQHDGHCIFLSKAGHCKVYSARPDQCRSYPFWPELVATRKSWLREATRCEGIDRGQAVPNSKIEKALQYHP